MANAKASLVEVKNDYTLASQKIGLSEHHGFEEENMNNHNSNESTWDTNIYTPEGNDRPSYNAPTTQRATDESDRPPLTVAEIVAQANRGNKT